MKKAYIKFRGAGNNYEGNKLLCAFSKAPAKKYYEFWTTKVHSPNSPEIDQENFEIIFDGLGLNYVYRDKKWGLVKIGASEDFIKKLDALKNYSIDPGYITQDLVEKILNVR